MGLTGWRLFSLVAAALLGGYALATAFGIFLGGVLPARGAAALTGNLLSFAVYAAAVIWVFAVRNPRRAWLGLLAPALVLTLTGLTLAGTSA